MSTLTAVHRIESNLKAVRDRIAAAARSAGREPGDVTLIAVSKRHSVEAIEAAIAAGHKDFGESRIQEVEAKWPSIRTAHPNVSLHFIGPLQTNKAKAAVTLCDFIHSLDRPKLARKLAAEMQSQDRRPPCFIQVNTGEEPQKAGIHPGDIDAFVSFCMAELGLPVAGLMCIPPMDDSAAVHFAYLGEIAKRHGLRQLSMGMSGDYEAAVRLGATHVRVGTAIFGERPD